MLGVDRMEYIYADNAATTRLSETAMKAMLPFFGEIYGNPSSLHSAGQRANEALWAARETVAKCLNASPKEIYFTSGGSEADNQAIRSAALAGAKKGKKHIVSTAFEHHAVLHTLKKLEKEGFEVTLLDVRGTGRLDPAAVEAAIREDTCLVTVMFANNEIGTVEPIREIGEICRRKNVPFHTDAVQLSVLIEGGAQERGKRAGTENLPGIAGMAAALEEADAKLEENAKKVSALRDMLIEGLSGIGHGVLNGDREYRLPGNVNFCFEGIEGEALLLLLDDKGIAASSGSAGTSGSLDPSHVLLAIGRPHAIAHGSLRLSIDETLTEEQARYMIGAVKETVAQLRAMSPVWRDLQSGKQAFLTE